MPHWGREFTYDLSATQKHQAAAFVAAGADLVLGSHSHWVGGVQMLEGGNGPAFVDYSMGDLLFDLNHDSESLEAEVVTLTFVGPKLVQVQLDPTVMIGGAQVGLLDPATDGKPVIDAIRLASRKLGW
jgi:poly-gamma-glutamate capsule biosynthesis protein CapA/YwtB (metallophosphatase superfamily)